MLHRGEQKGISSIIGQNVLWGLIGVLTLLGVTSGRGGTPGTGIAVAEALTPDQSFTSPSGLFADINECCRFVAQTFTAGLTGTLGGVNIEVRSPQISVFPLHVAIRTVIDGVPSTTVLGETTLSSSSAPLSLLITFPQVINITAGVQYAIVVNYEGAPPPGPGQSQGIWSGAIGDSYPGGRGYASFSDGISWFQLATPDGDLHFQTYVNVVPALDHFACYEVKCISDDKDRHGKVTECDTEEQRVRLFNQFTDENDKGKPDRDKGQIVLVGKLQLLCIPTKKVPHDTDNRH